MITCNLMWLPEPDEPWPPVGESPWRHRLVNLPAVPRKGDAVRLDGHGWEVGLVVWEEGKPVEVRIHKERD